MADEWISTREAAAQLGVAESTVYRWLANKTVRDEVWGAEGVGWRFRPILRRRIYQVSSKRVAELIPTEQQTPPGDSEPGARDA